MAKVAVSIKIDVTKIDKSRLFKGEKGTYLDLTTFIDLDEKDQYGNNGFISQSVSKDEKAQGVQTPILGNSRVFWSEGLQATPDPSQPAAGQSQPAAGQPDAAAGQADYDDDIPF